MLRSFFVLPGKCLRLMPRLYLFLGFAIYFWTGEDGDLSMFTYQKVDRAQGLQRYGIRVPAASFLPAMEAI